MWKARPTISPPLIVYSPACRPTLISRPSVRMAFWIALAQATPAAGVACASAIQKAVRTLGLEIRVGLHTGEYQLSGGEMVGLAFHIGTRVAAKARAGEVLVSSAVKELMTTQTQISLKDHGIHRLKGVPERWRLYRVVG